MLPCSAATTLLPLLPHPLQRGLVPWLKKTVLDLRMTTQQTMTPMWNSLPRIHQQEWKNHHQHNNHHLPVRGKGQSLREEARNQLFSTIHHQHHGPVPLFFLSLPPPFPAGCQIPPLPMKNLMIMNPILESPLPCPSLVREAEFCQFLPMIKGWRVCTDYVTMRVLLNICVMSSLQC